MSLFDKFNAKKRIVVMITEDYRLLVLLKDCFNDQLQLQRIPPAALHAPATDLRKTVPAHLTDIRLVDQSDGEHVHRCVFCDRIRRGEGVYGVTDFSGTSKARALSSDSFRQVGKGVQQSTDRTSAELLADILPVITAHRERLFVSAVRNSPPFDLRWAAGNAQSGSSQSDSLALYAMLWSAPIRGERFGAEVYESGETVSPERHAEVLRVVEEWSKGSER